MSEHEEIYTLQQLAQHLQVHASTIYKMVKKRQLPAFKVSRGWCFHKAAIDEWEKHQSEVAVYGSGRYESKVRSHVPEGKTPPGSAQNRCS